MKSYENNASENLREVGFKQCPLRLAEYRSRLVSELMLTFEVYMLYVLYISLRQYLNICNQIFVFVFVYLSKTEMEKTPCVICRGCTIFVFLSED